MEQSNFWVPVILFGLVGLFLLLMGVLYLAILAACRWEKQCVRDFVPVTLDKLPPPSPYFQAMNKAAEELGFQPGGLFGQDRNSSNYRCCVSLWLSPDRSTLLSIGGGKVAHTNYKRTMLISRMADENYLVTMDNFGIEDMTGTRDFEVLINADLTELALLHGRRLTGAGGRSQPFESHNLMAYIDDLKRMDADRLVENGLAYYLSRDENTWRYTTRGALKYGTKTFFKGLSRAQTQEHRSDKKRPGS